MNDGWKMDKLCQGGWNIVEIDENIIEMYEPTVLMNSQYMLYSMS